jgi:hypothetical protein
MGRVAFIEEWSVNETQQRNLGAGCHAAYTRLVAAGAEKERHLESG